MRTSSVSSAKSAGVSGIASLGGRTTSQKLAIPTAASPATASPSQISKRLRSAGGSGQRDVVVLADALQDEEDRRGLPRVDDEVWALGRNRVRLTRIQDDFLLGIAQEKTHAPLQDVKRVLRVV